MEVEAPLKETQANKIAENLLIRSYKSVWNVSNTPLNPAVLSSLVV